MHYKSIKYRQMNDKKIEQTKAFDARQVKYHPILQVLGIVARFSKEVGYQNTFCGYLSQHTSRHLHT